MATTSPDNIYSPDGNNQYALVQDLGAMADSVQSALVSRANSYRGTSAQRNAFTTAPTGTIWSDTNGDQLVYVRRGSSWVPVTPEDTGWVDMPLNAPFTGSAQYRIAGSVGSVAFDISGAAGSFSTSGSIGFSDTRIPFSQRPLTSLPRIPVTIFPSAGRTSLPPYPVAISAGQISKLQTSGADPFSSVTRIVGEFTWIL